MDLLIPVWASSNAEPPLDVQRAEARVLLAQLPAPYVRLIVHQLRYYVALLAGHDAAMGPGE